MDEKILVLGRNITPINLSKNEKIEIYVDVNENEFERFFFKLFKSTQLESHKYLYRFIYIQNL